MKKDAVLTISLLDMLSNFITAEELEKINENNFTPQCLLEFCVKTPGVLSATYFGDGLFEINSDAGIVKFKVTKKGGWKK